MEMQSVYGFKGVRRDGYSKFNFQFHYEEGKIYEEPHVDCNPDEPNSFGLSVWTKPGAEDYCSQKILKVRVHKDHIGCLTTESNKLRVSQLEVLPQNTTELLLTLVSGQAIPADFENNKG